MNLIKTNISKQEEEYNIMATWAKGVDFKNSANTARVGGVGIYGTDGTVEKAYLGVGTEPWNNTGLEVTSSTISFKGNKVYHAGDKPTPSEIGAAASSHGTHVTYSTTAPLANGTASAGSASTVARTDHVHPLQTSVSGNAGTATKLANSRTISVSGDATGSTSFDGSANATIALTLANSGATAGSYGPTANATTSFGGTFAIPQVTVDAKGRVTSVTSRTITMPSNPNSDTKVTNTLNTTSKAYITGTTSSSTNTGTQVFDTGVYLDTTAGHLTATQFNGTLNGKASSATSADSATKLITARTINGTSFDGTANITTSLWGTARNISIADSDATNTGSAVSVNGSGNVTLKLPSTIKATLTGNVSGNASTATTLATSRTINGTSFNGSGNITTSLWGTARNITIGSTTKSVNGSADVAWTLSEIGAAAASHTHSYLPLSGGTITSANFGPLIITRSGSTNGAAIAFANSNGTLGYVGMNGAANSGLVRYSADTSSSYTVLDTGNYKTHVTPANIGAAASSHTHSYLPLSGGTLTGRTTLNYTGGPRIVVNDGTNEIWFGVNSEGSKFGIYDNKAGAYIISKTTDGTVALNGNADTATILKTARTINGTSFNGSANITTAQWGTARTIYIADNAGSNTGTGVSVNGSANATLKLPATIAATLSGNASTATKLATARTISLGGILSGSASFDGSGNVTISAAANDITTITKSLTVTTSWTDTGITGTNLATGTYAVQMLVNDGTNTSQYNEYYSGIMSWYNATTNSTDADEILLHKAGHASNSRHVYLRTIRQSGSTDYLKLQISCTNAFTAASSIIFKFKKLI